MTADDFTRALTSEKLRTIYTVWRELSAGRIGPKRAELKLSNLRRAAAWSFTVDVIEGAKDFRVGFRGDRLIQFLGEPCEAQTLSGLLGTHFFDAADRLFRECVASGKPLVNGPKPTRYKGKEHLEREVLLLPLSEDAIHVTGILGAFDTWQLGTNRHVPTSVLAD